MNGNATSYMMPLFTKTCKSPRRGNKHVFNFGLEKFKAFVT